MTPFGFGYLPLGRKCPADCVGEPWGLAEGRVVESDQRFYFRRAAEERIAAQRAITETARQWHAQLAQQFADRASQGQQVAVA